MSRPARLAGLAVGAAALFALTAWTPPDPPRRAPRAAGAVHRGAASDAAGAPAVADAAQRGDLAGIRRLLARGGAGVNVAQGDGMTALHWAAERGDSLMTAALLRARADMGARTRVGDYTPLHLAARVGDAGTVRALLAAGADVKVTNAAGATALHLAADAGNADVVRALLARGADPNARESMWGQTPLVFAAERDRADAARALLAGGADPSIHTRVVNLMDQEARIQAAQKKRNALLIGFEPKARHDSADADHQRAVAAAKAQLAEAQAKQRAAAAPGPAGGAVRGAAPTPPRDPAQLVNAQDPAAALGVAARLPVREPRGPFTPAQIQTAIDSGRAVLLAATIPKDSAREQVDTANGGVAGYVKQVGSVGGLTALHHAARQGSVATAIALLEGGAKINDTSYVDRMTPLMIAAVNGQFDVALRLVEHGADPNVKTTYGMSPLYAVLNAQWAPKSRYPQPQALLTQQTSYLELAAALLAKGADPNARLGKQPWWFAYNNCGSFNCGLEVIDGTTPFWRAAYALDVDAMRLLKRNGAIDTIPSAPPKPAPRRPAGARADSARRAPGDTTTLTATAVAAARVGPPSTPEDRPAHASAGAAAPSMKPDVPPAAVAPIAVAVADHTTARSGRGRDMPNGTARTSPNDSAGRPALSPAGFGDPQFKLDPEIAAAARAAPVGAGVLPIHAAAGVGYGNGFAANAHRHAPDSWMPAMRYLVEELHEDVNARDNNGYTPLHHAAARGDDEMIRYLVSKGADVKAVSRTGRTVVDMANGPVQRLRPFPETIDLLEKLGAKNQHHCVSC